MAGIPVYRYANIKTATTTVVKSRKGILHAIVINDWVTANTITVYDNTAGSGTTIASIVLPTADVQATPTGAIYDLQFTVGLTIVTSGVVDLTITYA